MVGNDWDIILAEEYQQNYYKTLQKFINEQYEQTTVYPPKDKLYTALTSTSFANVRVVILGQDPYHGPNQAHGLSFSVANNDAKFPPSLRNIFKELASDLNIHRTEWNLSDWATQGVLLLNTVLTVEAGKAGSHRNRGWEKFTDKIIMALGKRKEAVAFVLWGNDAIKKQTLIKNQEHLIITCVHPSPLSAHRGFFGSAPFSTINNWLENQNCDRINW